MGRRRSSSRTRRRSRRLSESSIHPSKTQCLQTHSLTASEEILDCAMSPTAMELQEIAAETAARDSVRRQMRWLMQDMGMQQDDLVLADTWKRSSPSGGGMAAVRAKEMRAAGLDTEVADMPSRCPPIGSRMSIIDLAGSRKRPVRSPSLPSGLSRGAELSWLQRDSTRPLPLQETLSDALDELSVGLHSGHGSSVSHGRSSSGASTASRARSKSFNGASTASRRSRTVLAADDLDCGLRKQKAQTAPLLATWK